MYRFRTLIILLSGFAAVLFFLFISLTSRFNYLGVPIMSQSFADLRLVSSASECALNGDWSYKDLECDPWGRPFNYPSLWVKIFSFLGINENHTVLIGSLQIVILVLTIFWWVNFGLKATSLRGQKFLLIFIALFFSMSPPILLLMERGNVDIWIFFGLSVGVALFVQGKYYVPVAILSFLGALKIYPFASLLALFNFKITLRRLFFCLLTIVIAGCTFLGEWHFVLSRSITTWNSISYGSSMLPLILFQIFDVDGSKLLASVLGWTLFLFMVLLIRLSFGKYLNSLEKLKALNAQTGIVLSGFGSAFLFTYLVGTSYDLRLILLLPIFMSLSILMINRSQKLYFLLSVVVIMYGGQFTSEFGKVGLLLNLLSDISLSVFSSFLLLIIWRNILPKLGNFSPTQQHR